MKVYFFAVLVFILFCIVGCESPVEIISISPNPIESSADVKYSVGMEGDITITIVDLQGNEVLQIFNEYQNEGIYQKQFNILHLTTGVYFLKIQWEEYYTVEKIIKK